MKFVAPEFLWALTAISVPIIIHLFNFRRYKTVFFSDVRFLKEVKEETRRQSNLKHILILLARIFTLTALVLAFAQPFIPGKSNDLKQGDTVVSIYLDNSFSMDDEGTEASLLNMGRQIAVELADKFDQTTQFQLLTNEFKGYQQRLVNKDEFLRMLDETRKTPVSRTFSDVFRRQAEALNSVEAANKMAFAISDFQRNMVTKDIPPDSIGVYNAIMLAAEGIGNVYIDSLWFESPVRQKGKPEVLKARVRNTTVESLNLKVYLNLNGRTHDTDVEVAADSWTEAALSFRNNSTGFQAGHVSLRVPGNQIRFDDTLYLSYNVLDKLSVLEISDETESTFFNIFGEDEDYLYQKTAMNAVDLDMVKAQNLIILNGADEISSGLAARLKDFVASGGSLAVYPGENINLDSYGNFLLSMQINTYGYRDTQNVSVKTIRSDHLFFQDVFETIKPNMDLPKTYSHYSISGSYESGEVELFTLFNEKPLLSVYNVGNGKVYLSAVPLNDRWSNLRKHALFVTSALRMAELSFPNRPLYYTIGAPEFPEIIDRGYNQEVSFILKQNEHSVIPLADRTKPGVIGLITSYGGEDDMLESAGPYDLEHDEKKVDILAYNFGREESKRDFITGIDSLKKELSRFNIRNLLLEAPESIAEAGVHVAQSKPKEYWKICLILALAFIGIEVALIRLWKT